MIILQRLASAIDQSNVMLARQVVRTDAGEEKVVDLRQTCSVSTHKDNKNKENAHPTVLPAYLPEEDSPVKVRLLPYMPYCQHVLQKPSVPSSFSPPGNPYQ